mgnify:CR=1 FL=1
MEAKISIAEILKDKPQGTKLYSLTYGDCSYQGYTGDFGIECQSQKGVQFNLDEYGKYCIEGECILFPSKEMRDWSKISWEKGDVLVSNDGGTEVIFYNWYDDTYTNFYGKHRLDSENKNNIKYNDAFLLCTTGRYSLEDKDAAQTYINTIEERLGGKINRETLEIEKQPEFKDGDILYITDRIVSCNFIMIYQNQEGDRIYHYATLPEDNLVIMTKRGFLSDNGGLSMRYATEEEKQLFEALAKEGKAWDAEKKQIVDLKPKWTPKPFDRVITRTPDTPWTANFFSHIDSDGVKNCIDDRYLMCLPYNEETAKLIGTTDDWKG